MADRQPIKFGTTCYQASSGRVSSEQLANMFPEANPQTANGPVTLYTRPVTGSALTFDANAMTTSIVGMIEISAEVEDETHSYDKCLLAVTCDRHVYLIGYTASTGYFDSFDGGELPTSAGVFPISYLICNGSQVAIANSSGVWCVARAGTGVSNWVLTKVSDMNANGAALIDGYGIYPEADTDNFWISDIDDLATINALDFSAADAFPDTMMGCAALNRELLLFGTKSVERWYNAGSAAFPFVRSQGGFKERGCVAPHSIMKVDSKVLWLADDYSIWMYDGQSMSSISTPPIVKLIVDAVAATVALGETQLFHASAHTINDKPTYMLVLCYDADGDGNFTATLTLAYDIRSGTWAKWDSTDYDGVPIDVIATAALGYTSDVFASLAGNIVALSRGAAGGYIDGVLAGTDDGQMPVVVDSPPVVANSSRRVSMAEVVVDCETVNSMEGDELVTNGNMSAYAVEAAAPDDWSATAGVTPGRYVGRGGAGYSMVGSWSDVTNAGITTTVNGPAHASGLDGNGWAAYGQYLITWWARAVSGNAIGAVGGLAWADQSPGSSIAVSNPALTTDWQQYKFRVQMGATPETKSKLTIYGAAGIAASTAGAMQIDDISVVREDGGALSLYWSDDGGQTWSGPKVANVSASGGKTFRTIFSRLGAFVNRTLRLTFGENAGLVILNASARIEVRE